MNVGSRIKAAREAKKMTQEELGKACGTTKQSIFKYETGVVTNIPLDKVETIAHVLDISPAVLMGWEKCDIPSEKSISYIKDDIKKSPPITDEAVSVGRGYDTLDHWGKKQIRDVLNNELARRRERQAPLDEYGGQEEPRVIPLYFTPAAAGYASPAFGEDFEYLEVEGDVPWQADYAVRIDGDSMEPYIADGSIVYVNRDPLADGDIGIFCVDGDMLCKQYKKDVDGTVHLLSLNRDRADADRHIKPDSGLSITCLGRGMV